MHRQTFVECPLCGLCRLRESNVGRRLDVAWYSLIPVELLHCSPHSPLMLPDSEIHLHLNAPHSGDALPWRRAQLGILFWLTSDFHASAPGVRFAQGMDRTEATYGPTSHGNRDFISARLFPQKSEALCDGTFDPLCPNLLSFQTGLKRNDIHPRTPSPTQYLSKVRFLPPQLARHPCRALPSRPPDVTPLPIGRARGWAFPLRVPAPVSA
ncbi:hypothetical protein JTE90_016777 [Oedothorax gibbosus]|uniref:Uncharacterized protein n=1 Tax=Oedothorax gibbosus TaxID=931172 RepID=A0AAV6VXW5_9ARAC|nr:hypothetical protein JTE90_016777 [Oedothorax gibbosus]